jgi:hypothetical protein
MPETPNFSEYTHNERMEAARRYATWYLGYPEWADNLINAYNNPKDTHKQLDADEAQFDA